MTNEQTAIMLKGIAKQIETTIESAEEQLIGADVQRNTEERYIGEKKHSFGVQIHRSPADYETVETTPVCLDEIKSSLQIIETHILDLLPTK